jgi:hypothetical protein
VNLSPTVWSAIVVLATMGLTATSLFLVTFGGMRHERRPR